MAENYKKVFIIFVLILLFSPFFIGFIEKDLVASQVEKRKLAPFQDIYNVKTFKEVFNSFEAYLNDHFGLRENYISLYHGVKRLLPKRYDLKSSVIEGKDGWLFLRDGLELYLGNRSNEGIQKFIQNLEGFIKQVSPIPVVMVAVPSKAFVIEEKLP